VPSAFLLSAVERLFSRNGLGEVRAVEVLPGGQLNTVLRLNEDLVLRCREAVRSTGSLRREAVLLRRLKGRVPVAEVVLSGMDDLLGEYLLVRHLPGRTLLRSWIEHPETPTREWWLTQWAGMIRAIHEVRFPQPGELPEGELKAASSWRSYIEQRIRKRLDLLMRMPQMDREFILAAERFTRRNASALEDGPCCLIHRDLHFGNVLVEGPHVTAVLDFELAEAGPPDYELDTIYRFLRYPWMFGDPETGAHLTASRFASVWVRLKRAYPEMFAVRSLRQRLCLYALDHDLSCLVQAYGGRWGGEAGAELALRRLADVLRGDYGPE
jgi:aminoglycoside phosphotransferase (APT) family kinase protein